MSIVKVIGIAFLGMICAGLLKEIKPSLSIFVGVMTGIVIIFSIVDELKILLEEFDKIAEIASVDATLITTIIKIIGIGYISEFSATITDDYGMPGIGKKILLASKILIAILALPIISNIISSVTSIMK